MVVLETRAPLQERVDPECLSRDPLANTRGFHGEGLALRTCLTLLVLGGRRYVVS